MTLLRLALLFIALEVIASITIWSFFPDFAQDLTHWLLLMP